MDEESIEEKEDEETENLYSDLPYRYFDTYEEVDWIRNQNNGIIKGIKL